MTPAEAQFLRDFILPIIQREHQSTVKVLRALPAEQSLYKPHPKAMTALDLAWHTARSESWALKAVLGGSFEHAGSFARPAAVADTPAVAETYVRELPPLYAQLAAADPVRLATPIPFFGRLNEPAIAYVQMLLLGHCLHHRGQLTTYLRAMDARVPAVYGNSADEPMAR